MSWRRSPVLKGVLLALLAVAVSGGFAWIADAAVDHYRDRYLRRVRDGADPATRDLADGKFHAGDPLKALLTRHPPEYVCDHDGYTTAAYVNGNRMTIVAARDGKLVYARACGYMSPIYDFFDAFPPGELHAWGTSYQKAMNERFAVFVVAGFAGATHPNP